MFRAHYLLLLLMGIPLTSWSKDIGTDIDELNIMEPYEERESNGDEKKASALGHFAKAYFLLLENRTYNEEIFNEFLSAVSNDPEARLPLKFMFQAWKALGKEERLSNKIIDTASANPEALILNMESARIAYSMDKAEKAAELLERSLEAIDDEPEKRGSYIAERYKKNHSGVYQEATILLSKIYISLEEYSKGDDLFEDIFELDGMTEDFRLIRSAVFFYSEIADKGEDGFFSGWSKRRYRRRLESYLADFERLCRENRYKIREIIPVLKVYERYSMYNRSERLLCERILADPNDLAAYLFLAAVYYDSERYSLAALVWKKLLADNPAEARFYYELGRAHYMNGDYDDTVRIYEKYNAKKPGNPEVIFRLGVSYFNTGEYEKAISTLMQMNGSPDSEYVKAKSYSYLGRYAEALESMKKAEQYAKELNYEHFLSRKFYIDLSFAYDYAGEHMKAVEILRELYEKYPEDPDLCNSLGYLLADNKMELDFAEELIEDALDEDDENPAYLDSMAWVLYRKGDYEGAFDYMEECLEYSTCPPDPVIADHAGDIYFALGDRENALKYWKLALESISIDVDRKRIEEKIRKCEDPS